MLSAHLILVIILHIAPGENREIQRSASRNPIVMVSISCLWVSEELLSWVMEWVMARVSNIVNKSA